MDILTLALMATAAFLAAGVVKGIAGMGLPTTAIGLMTLAIDPRTAIAVVLAPMLFTNLWQVLRSGEALRALRQYAWFGGALALFVWVTITLSAEVSDRVILGVLGGVILVFVGVNLRFTLPQLPTRYDRTAQLGFGSAAGVVGGLTGVWAPPLAIYLTARGTPKDEFVRASGLLIFVGSTPLALGYVQQGFLTWELALISAALIAPTLIGFSVGEALRKRLSQERFRLVFLYIFLALGLNLIRRAIF